MNEMSTEFQLTAENYYSDEANRRYLSVSQFKDFHGTYGRMGCEEMALAKIKGEYRTEPTNAMMIGSYVDSYYEGTLEEFKNRNPQIFRKDGQLMSGFKKAEEIIERTERDELFQKYMSGQKQVIMTAELFGVPWKIKMDSYLEGKAIVDLKVMATLTKLNWVPDIGYLDFVRYWGYDLQGAIYQEVVYLNTGKRLPFYIAGASKEDDIDIELIHVTQNYLDEAKHTVEMSMPRILRVKNGEVEPDRCDTCGWCRKTKVLKKPISIMDLTASI